MGKYDGLTAKELRTRLLEADKSILRWEKTAKELNDASKPLYVEISELKKYVEDESRKTKLANDRVHALSHDLNYERSRRISAENARFDLEQRLHGLASTHIEVPQMRVTIPGLHIDRNGDIA